MITGNNNHPFKRILEAMKPDQKQRISIAKVLTDEDLLFDVYVNDLGQIMLDPVKTVPAYETWILENQSVLESIKRGLRQAKEGKTKYLGSFAKYAKD